MKKTNKEDSMKTKVLLTGVLAVLAYGGMALAHGGEDHDEATEQKEASATAPAPAKAVADEAVKAVEVGNTMCPVSGHKVGEMGGVVSYEYEGKLYNTCCKMCFKDFEKDPKKYAKIAEDQAATVKAESVTTNG